MSFDLAKVLLHSLEKKQLSPFYIIKTGPQTPEPKKYLESWLKQLLANTISKTKGFDNKHSLQIVDQGHADILWQKREDPTKNYNIKDGDLNELFSFMEYGALELPWRFAVIEDPHKLSNVYLNKLLKTLEEPAKNTSVIFLDYENTRFLDTIHSRAIEFTLVDDRESTKWDKLPESINVADWFNNRKIFYPNTLENDNFLKLLICYFENGTDLAKLIDKFKTIPNADNELAGIIVEYEADRPGRFKQKEELCKELEWFQYSKTYNNSSWERVLGMLMVVNS